MVQGLMSKAWVACGMNTGSTQPLVFVYGSLRRGGFNHHYLHAAAYLGEHVSAAAYTMFDLGTYPGVVATGATRIKGEVYAIDTLILEHLDVLEDYPCSYGRRLLDTPWGAAWIYLYQQALLGSTTVAQGDWLMYMQQRVCQPNKLINC
jgi:gamma-glutamylcyclotransferase (GGCT)/AIG2-like uncharacterized protein YtfP